MISANQYTQPRCHVLYPRQHTGTLAHTRERAHRRAAHEQARPRIHTRSLPHVLVMFLHGADTRARAHARTRTRVHVHARARDGDVSASTA